MKYWRKLQELLDIKSGTALGLTTLSFCWALLHGKDIGMGAGMALSSVYGAYAATKIRSKIEDMKTNVPSTGGIR